MTDGNYAPIFDDPRINSMQKCVTCGHYFVREPFSQVVTCNACRNSKMHKEANLVIDEHPLDAFGLKDVNAAYLALERYLFHKQLGNKFDTIGFYEFFNGYKKYNKYKYKLCVEIVYNLHKLKIVSITDIRDVTIDKDLFYGFLLKIDGPNILKKRGKHKQRGKMAAKVFVLFVFALGGWIGMEFVNWLME